MIKKIPHTQEELTNIFDYNAEDGSLIWREKPSQIVKSKSIAGGVSDSNGKQYCRVKLGGKKYLAHRIIYKMVYGDFDESLEIDHIDHNGLNNKIDNLRLVSHIENTQNQLKRIDNTSGMVGISWDKNIKKWRTYINANKNFIYLGSFNDIKEAVMTRMHAEILFGFHPNHGK